MGKRSIVGHICIGLITLVPGSILAVIAGKALLGVKTDLLNLILGLLGLYCGLALLTIYAYLFKRDYLKPPTPAKCFKEYKIIYFLNLPFMVLPGLTSIVTDPGRAIGFFLETLAEHPTFVKPLIIIGMALFFILLLKMVDLLLVLRSLNKVNLTTSFFVIGQILLGSIINMGGVIIPSYLYYKAERNINLNNR